MILFVMVAIAIAAGALKSGCRTHTSGVRTLLQFAERNIGVGQLLHVATTTLAFPHRRRRDSGNAHRVLAWRLDGPHRTSTWRIDPFIRDLRRENSATTVAPPKKDTY